MILTILVGLIVVGLILGALTRGANGAAGGVRGLNDLVKSLNTWLEKQR